MALLKNNQSDDLTLKYLLQNAGGNGGGVADNGLPDGGDEGDFLVKASEANYDASWQAMVDVVYPIGSIYISTNSTSPASLFGGTWARITGKFLLAATDGGAQGGNGDAEIEAGYSGGEATHKITTSEMAAHTHGSKSLTGNLWNMAVQSASQNVSFTGIVSSRGGSEGVGYATSSNTRADGVTINATHTHDSVGSGTAHNNMPPYLAVYVWERTA